MAAITAADLAEHIAAILDGDYDDGLEAYVSASAKGDALSIGLESDGVRVGAYRLTVERTE